MQFAIVADNQKQSLALAEVVDKLGFFVVATFKAQELGTAPLPKKCTWLIDTDDYNETLQNAIAQSDPVFMLMGFNDAPYKASGDVYERWQRIVMRRLSELLHLSMPPRAVAPKNTPWRYVLFLGASMGGPDALKQFLDRLRSDLPLAILLAHHYDSQMLGGLPKILTRHNHWRCKVITTSQKLQSGTCLVVPTDQQIVCDSTGRIILMDKPWVGTYRPNIGTLLKNASEVFASQLYAIIFSGMGDDGSQFAKELPVNGSTLWAQDPTTCQSPSQPKAFIDSGVCQFIGSPVALADRLNALLTPLTAQ